MINWLDFTRVGIFYNAHYIAKYDFLAKKICLLLGQMRPQKSSTTKNIMIKF